MEAHFQDERFTVYHGDCVAVMAEMEPESIDAIVTDPPYDLLVSSRNGSRRSNNPNSPAGRHGDRHGGGFMNMAWDGTGVAFKVETWRAALRVLKPGGYMVAFGGTRTSHRMVCAIEDAGFEIRDSLVWLYGSGFPKSHDVSKGIDKAAGAERQVVGSKLGRPGMAKDGHNQKFNQWREQEQRGDRPPAYTDVTAAATDDARQWEGWGTALKPAHEPIVLARKPLSGGTVAGNVLRHGTGAINIDGCRIDTVGRPLREVHPLRDRVAYHGNSLEGRLDGSRQSSKAVGTTDTGRWPANVVLDEEAAAALDAQSGERRNWGQPTTRVVSATGYGGYGPVGDTPTPSGYNDTGGASRFFYTTKASAAERQGVTHPTVKPVALIRWLCRLITPPGGVVLDCFAGSGTTRLAALAEGFRCVLIEQNADYLEQLCGRAAQQGFDLEVAG